MIEKYKGTRRLNSLVVGIISLHGLYWLCTEDGCIKRSTEFLAKHYAIIYAFDSTTIDL